MKVVINRRYGGFGVSTAAVRRMREFGSRHLRLAPLFATPWAPYWLPVDTYFRGLTVPSGAEWRR